MVNPRRWRSVAYGVVAVGVGAYIGWVSSGFAPGFGCSGLGCAGFGIVVAAIAFFVLWELDGYIAGIIEEAHRSGWQKTLLVVVISAAGVAAAIWWLRQP